MRELAGWGVEVVDWSASPLPWGADRWPIGVAVLWIAWRDREAVEREWRAGVLDLDAKFREGQLMPLRDAQATLWAAIASDQLAAAAAFEGGRAGGEMPADLWTPKLAFEGRAALVYTVGGEVRRFVAVDVPSARVVELWPATFVQAFTCGMVEGSTDRERVMRGDAPPPDAGRSLGGKRRHAGRMAALVRARIDEIIESERPNLVSKTDRLAFTKRMLTVFCSPKGKAGNAEYNQSSPPQHPKIIDPQIIEKHIRKRGKHTS